MSVPICRHCDCEFEPSARKQAYCSLACAVYGRATISAFDDACWEWQAAVGSHGYGVFAFCGQMFTAHRASYIATFGDIPKAEGSHGGVVMHKCDNRRCVNPSHLVAGSQKDNLLDCVAKFRRSNTLRREQVLEIRKRRAAGERIRDIAVAMGVKPVTVQGVASGRNHRNVR